MRVHALQSFIRQTRQQGCFNALEGSCVVSEEVIEWSQMAHRLRIGLVQQPSAALGTVLNSDVVRHLHY